MKDKDEMITMLYCGFFFTKKHYLFLNFKMNFLVFLQETDHAKTFD